MKDFNDYRQGQNEDNSFNNLNGELSGNLFEQFASLAAKYEGQSADVLMRAILKEAERGRKNGTLSDDDINAFSNAVSPMLNDSQRKTLDKIVKKLKNQ